MGNKSTTSKVSKPSVTTEEHDDINEKENKENTTVIWFDPTTKSNHDTEKLTEQLRVINDYVKIFTSRDQCVNFIKTINNEKVFLIISGLKASQILPHISDFHQVDSIFIYCMKEKTYDHLLNEYSKILSVYTNLDELYKSIQENIDLVDDQLQTLSYFDQNQKLTGHLSKELTRFIWFQFFNHAAVHLSRTGHGNKELIEMCRHYYHGNVKELELINQFEHEYQPNKAIYWYSKKSFISKLLNKALKIEDIDLLYKFRQYIADLSENLQHEHRRLLLSNENTFIVYRGGKLGIEEFNTLKENQGKLMSTNGYLSATHHRSLAHSFALKPTKHNDVLSVLFEIECNTKEIGNGVIFADTNQFTKHPNENEVLFDLNVCFKIESMEQHGTVELIRLKASNAGEIIIKDYIELTQRETEEKSILILFGKLMCDLGEYDKAQKYFEKLLNDPNDEDLAWIEFNLGRVLCLKGLLRESREYSDRAYKRMMNHQPARIRDSAYVRDNIGLILEHQRKYDEALDYF